MTRLADDYRLERAAQDARFDSRPGAGAVDHTMTGTEEYQAYFGLGEYAGAGVEERVTYRSFLQARGRERVAAESVPLESTEPDFTPADILRLPGAVVRSLAEGGFPSAAAELERRQARRQARRAMRLGVA